MRRTSPSMGTRSGRPVSRSSAPSSHTYGMTRRRTADEQRPPAQRGEPQAVVFVKSLFEIDVPTHYPNRARWIIDQGNANAGFRSGGFWGAGTLIYLVITFAMLMAYRRREGFIAGLAGLGLLAFVAVLPQSNELRYYMFIPLTWAATIGMLLPHIRREVPAAERGLPGPHACALRLHGVRELGVLPDRAGGLSTGRRRLGRVPVVAEDAARTDLLRRRHDPDRRSC